MHHQVLRLPRRGNHGLEATPAAFETAHGARYTATERAARVPELALVAGFSADSVQLLESELDQRLQQAAVPPPGRCAAARFSRRSFDEAPRIASI
jgi:hypothetical protein